MRIEKWNPFREMDDLFRNYQRALMRPSLFEQGSITNSDWVPAVDILEDPKEYLLKVEIPEISKDDISIQLNRGILTVNGERKLDKTDDKQHRIERFYGSFSRSFTLPDNVDPKKIEAKFNDGMLYIHMPKTEPSEDKPLQIDIH